MMAERCWAGGHILDGKRRLVLAHEGRLDKLLDAILCRGAGPAPLGGRGNDLRLVGVRVLGNPFVEVAQVGFLKDGVFHPVLLMPSVVLVETDRVAVSIRYDVPGLEETL